MFLVVQLVEILVIEGITGWLENVGVHFLQRLGWFRPRRSACAVCIVSGGTVQRTAAMMRSTLTIISAGSPCARSPAVLACRRGFRGVVLVLRGVTVFELVRRCISRDGSIDLAQDLRPQLFRHAWSGWRR